MVDLWNLHRNIREAITENKISRDIKYNPDDWKKLDSLKILERMTGKDPKVPVCLVF